MEMINILKLFKYCIVYYYTFGASAAAESARKHRGALLRVAWNSAKFINGSDSHRVNRVCVPVVVAVITL